MHLNSGDAVAAISVEPLQEEAPNPNILSAAEAVLPSSLNGNGSSDGAVPHA
jgi:hypothetical protein